MDLRKLKTLIDLVAESGISELEITEGDGRVRIVKGPTAGQMPPMMHAQPAVHMAPMMPAAQSLPTGAPQAQAPDAAGMAPAAEPAGHVVKSPMVGTFYRAPSPEAPPFVEVGSEVRAGDPLCLIEVMKLFTTIYAEQGGRVVRIGAGDGELVEYGRVLIVIEPSS